MNDTPSDVMFGLIFPAAILGWENVLSTLLAAIVARQLYLVAKRSVAKYKAKPTSIPPVKRSTGQQVESDQLDLELAVQQARTREAKIRAHRFAH